VDRRIWWKAKILPYKQTTAAYGTAIESLPSQIAYGRGVKKCHVIVLWRGYKGHLITLEIIASKDAYVERLIV